MVVFVQLVSNKQSLVLMAAMVAAGSIFMDQAPAQGADKVAQQKVDPYPATYADPAVPLLQLPAKFRARRDNASIAAEAGKPAFAYLGGGEELFLEILQHLQVALRHGVA